MKRKRRPISRTGNGVEHNGRPRGERPVLITGGAGFIGTNVAARYASEGHPVLIYDNLSRAGVEENARWLTSEFGDRIELLVADVLDEKAVQQAVKRASLVFHFAAQVAVTTSLDDPRHDFEVNARGTLNVLEACRSLAHPPPLLFTSTNKVYGDLEDVTLVREDGQYRPVDGSLRQGINEDRPLDFHSPYGCSKGVADQYVLDYARCYEIPTVVFRMSCIYGPHQCGTEDQGWVAHFARAVLEDQPLTVYGDGCQVRDLLFVEDLVNAMQAAMEEIETTQGRAFNMGGGPANAASVLQVIQNLGTLNGSLPDVEFGAWRQGDQRYYVSSTKAFRESTGWTAQVGTAEGIERLHQWLSEKFVAEEILTSEH